MSIRATGVTSQGGRRQAVCQTSCTHHTAFRGRLLSAEFLTQVAPCRHSLQSGGRQPGSDPSVSNGTRTCGLGVMQMCLPQSQGRTLPSPSPVAGACVSTPSRSPFARFACETDPVALARPVTFEKRAHPRPFAEELPFAVQGGSLQARSSPVDAAPPHRLAGAQARRARSDQSPIRREPLPGDVDRNIISALHDATADWCAPFHATLGRGRNRSRATQRASPSSRVRSIHPDWRR